MPVEQDELAKAVSGGQRLDSGEWCVEDVPAPIIKMLLDYWSDTNREPETVRKAIEEVTGKPARARATWAADHAAEFRG